MKNVVGKNYFYHTLYQIVMLITPLITTPYISRVLLPEGVGTYSFYYTIVQYFVILGNLGFSTYGQIEISKVRYDNELKSKLFWEIFIMRFIAYIFSAILCLIPFFLVSDKRIMSILLLLILAGALDISWMYFGLDDFKSVSLRNILIRIISIVGIFVFVKTQEDLNVYALILTFSTLFGNCIIWVGVWRKVNFVKLRNLELLKHLKPALTFFIPNIAVVLYTMSDRTMIGLITNSAAQNGYYEQAHKIEQIFVQLLLSVAVVYRSQMALLFKTKDESKIIDNINRAITVLLFLSIPMCFGLIAVSRDLVGSFLGIEYLDSIAILRVFSPLLIVISISNCMSNMYLIVNGKIKEFTIATILGATINIILNLFLIYWIGALGAAVSSLIAEFIILILFYFYSKEYFKITTFIIPFMKYLFAAIIMLVAVLFISQYLAEYSIWSAIIEAIIGASIYLIIVIILRDKLIFNVLNKIFKRKGY